eukprot:359082-Chlamydomonas_euryale.AAC.4
MWIRERREAETEGSPVDLKECVCVRERERERERDRKVHQGMEEVDPNLLSRTLPNLAYGACVRVCMPDRMGCEGAKRMHGPGSTCCPGDEAAGDLLMAMHLEPSSVACLMVPGQVHGKSSCNSPNNTFYVMLNEFYMCCDKVHLLAPTSGKARDSVRQLFKSNTGIGFNLRVS